MKKAISLLLSAALLLGCFASAMISASAATKLTPGYYVVGSMNNWTLDKSFQMRREADDRGGDAGAYYVLSGVWLNDGDELKVVYSEDGIHKTVWYPADGSQTNYVVTEDAYYKIVLGLPTDETLNCWEWQLMVEPCDPPTDEPQIDDADYWDKMTPALIKALHTPDDDPIEVYIFLKDCPEKWRVEERVSQKYTWKDEQEHLMYYRREMAATIGAYMQQFIDDHAALLDEIILQLDCAEFVIASVSKEHAVELAKLAIVQDMDTYGEYSDPPTNGEPWIANMIVDAVNERNFDPRHTITARDINVFDAYQFKAVPAYAVYFSVRNLQYYAVMLEERIGDWLLVSSHPEPYLFINDRLYGFKEAYDEGLMTDEMLAELAASEFRGNCRYPILTRYIKGDADGDGACNIIDATVIQRHEANIALESAFFKPLADVDGDSAVSVIDATLIQRSEAGLYTIE